MCRSPLESPATYGSESLKERRRGGNASKDESSCISGDAVADVWRKFIVGSDLEELPSGGEVGGQKRGVGAKKAFMLNEWG